MIYSYTQVSQYLACPRRYRYRYLDGWRERDSRAALLFGRAFETAVAAYFLGEDAQEKLFREWSACREQSLDYPNGASWDRMLHEGVQLLDRLAQEDRIQIVDPRCNLQVKIVRPLPNGNEFIGYFDAIGCLDGHPCLIEWKTSGSRYPEQPDGLLALDSQLIAYSWISGMVEVAMVVFVRKRAPEIQYLRTSITEEQRQQYGLLVEETIGQIEAARFSPHSGIRFPQNGCLSCPFLGLCLENKDLVDGKLVRQPGASELEWLDQLDC